jgi:hypothetical protein
VTSQWILAEATLAHRRAGRLVGTRTHQPVPLAETPERQEPLCRAEAGWGFRRGGITDGRVEGKRQEIDGSAITCLYCQRDVRPWTARHIPLIIVGGVLMSLFVMAVVLTLWQLFQH